MQVPEFVSFFFVPTATTHEVMIVMIVVAHEIYLLASYL